jgi:ABC-type uncharacterized transport system auxiliary subunit
MKFKRSVIGCFSILVLLSSCTLFTPVKTVRTTTYVLTDPVLSPNHSASHATKSLLVAVPSAPRWLNSSDMAYQTSASKINYFAENEWIAPPALMLEPIIAHALQQSGLYHAVVQAPFGGNVSERLDVQILTMQQDFTENPSVFSYTIPTVTNNPEGGVQAANKGIEEWIPELIAFCRRSPANT